MSVAIYIRTSTKEQNPENQLADCLKINQWGSYEVFEDKQSAWKDNVQREKLREILKSIKGSHIKHLIVWDLDRIYRNRKKLIGFFELCKAYKVKVHSYRQSWLDDIHKVPEPWNEIIYDLFLQLMGYWAEDESNKKSERVKAAVRQSKKGTVSYKGNQWGRKGISTQKKNKILALRSEKKSIRVIASEVGVSVGVVHKTLSVLEQEKEPKNSVQNLVN